MLRSTTIYIFTVLLLLEVFHKAIQIVYFVTFRQEIISKHCVNKEKISMKCNGKCHLAKMLKETETNNANIPSIPSGKLKKLLDQETYYYPTNTSEISFKNKYKHNLNTFAYYKNYQFTWHNYTFHPPDPLTYS